MSTKPVLYICKVTVWETNGALEEKKLNQMHNSNIMQYTIVQAMCVHKL